MAMELEYIFKIMILLVVVAVIIGLVLSFRDQISNMIKQFLQNLGGGKQTFQLKIIDKGTGVFTSKEVATYIQSCYAATTSMSAAEIPAGVTNCYVLRGNFNVDKSTILQSITDSSLQDKVNISADFSTNAVIVAYQDPEGIILVK